MSGADHRRLAADILRWYVEAGVDFPVGEEPRDRFAEAEAELAARAAPPPAAPPRAAAVGAPDAVVLSARDLAAAAPDLASLEAVVRAFDGCALKETATQLVFADGNPQARIMFVGEAPGREEDISGKPFVGRSGQLLDRMMAAIGLDRTRAYIANVVPWRPPGNRTPTPHETEICKHFIERQIALSGAEFLVTLGQAASQQLLGRADSMGRMRGRWNEVVCGGRTLKTIALFHPAFLLRSPAQKRLAWRDLREIRRRLDAEQSGSG